MWQKSWHPESTESEPLLKPGQYGFGRLIMFHLVSVTCSLDEDQVIFICAGHVVIEILQKLSRVSVSEIVPGAT